MHQSSILSSRHHTCAELRPWLSYSSSHHRIIDLQGLSITLMKLSSLSISQSVFMQDLLNTNTGPSIHYLEARLSQSLKKESCNIQVFLLDKQLLLVLTQRTICNFKAGIETQHAIDGNKQTPSSRTERWGFDKHLNNFNQILCVRPYFSISFKCETCYFWTTLTPTIPYLSSNRLTPSSIEAPQTNRELT